jgi:hypothetical protein
MKRIILLIAALAALAVLAVAGCGGSGAVSNSTVEHDIQSTLLTQSMQPDTSVSVSCSHDQGNKFTCDVGSTDQINQEALDGPGIYSVTDDGNSKDLYYQKVG